MQRARSVGRVRRRTAAQLAVPQHTVLAANSTAKLGTVVIDDFGWTLYRSDADSAKPSKSACTGSCTDSGRPCFMQPGTPDYEGVNPRWSASSRPRRRSSAGDDRRLDGVPARERLGPAGAVDGRGAQGKWFAVTRPGEGDAALTPSVCRIAGLAGHGPRPTHRGETPDSPGWDAGLTAAKRPTHRGETPDSPGVGCPTHRGVAARLTSCGGPGRRRGSPAGRRPRGVEAGLHLRCQVVERPRPR